MKDDAPPIDLVLHALGIERSNASKYSARCPAHDDESPSLAVSVKPDGTVGLHCHTGCDTGEVCAALGLTLSDLFPKNGKPKATPKPRTPGRRALPSSNVAPVTAEERQAAWDAATRLGGGSFTGFKLTELYCYRYANGKTWGWRARYESKSGEKQIKPFHHDGAEWLMKERAAPRKGKPLYRLPDVLATDGPIYIVEGEKCADALAAIGIAATTSGAAKSAGKGDWASIAGRLCVIWPDNDDPGEQYAADVAKILRAIGCEVRTIDLATLDLPNEGDDAADWISANPNATAAEVLALPTIEPAQDSQVMLVRASDIEPKAIDWLWPGWLARAMLAILAGNGGTGKTTLALSIAATITKGGKLPDGTTAPRGSVIMWSGEDALAEVLVPRLQEAGADLSRVHFITVSADGNVFDPATDMPALERVARRIPDLALIIIDPVVSAVSGDSHKNAEVRRGLQPLLTLAADSGAAIIGITHYAKNTAGRSTTERVIGSVAFSAMARIVMATAMGPDGEARLVRSKSNIGITGDGFGYSIKVANREIGGTVSQVSKIAWGQPLYGRADDLLAQIESKRMPRDEAAEWLTAALHAGPVGSKDLQEKAKADGIAWRTIERAKDALSVLAYPERAKGKGRGHGRWMWELPRSQGVAERGRLKALR